jgi:hypothetical protein
VQHGKNRRTGSERSRGGQHILRLVHQVRSYLRTAIGDVVKVVVAGFVVRRQLRAERRLDHRQFRRSGQHRPQPPGQPHHRDPQQRPQPGRCGNDRQLRRRIPQTLRDLTRGDQRGDGPRYGEQPQRGEHTGADLAREQSGCRTPVHLPGHLQGPQKQRRQPSRHGASGQLRTGLLPGLVPVQELLVLLSVRVVRGTRLRRAGIRLILCGGRGQRGSPLTFAAAGS